MRVAILHYHLKPGGVTRVIENTVRELEKAGVESLVFLLRTAQRKGLPVQQRPGGSRARLR